MAAQANIVQSAVGQSAAAALQLNQFHFGVGLLCTVNLGNATAVNYGVKVTGDRVTGTIANWNDHDVLKNLTASANDNLRYPCTALALLVNSVTTPGNAPWTGNVTLAIVQAFG